MTDFGFEELAFGKHDMIIKSSEMHGKAPEMGAGQFDAVSFKAPNINPITPASQEFKRPF